MDTNSTSINFTSSTTVLVMITFVNTKNTRRFEMIFKSFKSRFAPATIEKLMAGLSHPSGYTIYVVSVILLPLSFVRA